MFVPPDQQSTVWSIESKEHHDDHMQFSPDAMGVKSEHEATSLGFRPSKPSSQARDPVHRSGDSSQHLRQCCH